jgi:hypothetical protein
VVVVVELSVVLLALCFLPFVLVLVSEVLVLAPEASELVDVVFCSVVLLCFLPLVFVVVVEVSVDWAGGGVSWAIITPTVKREASISLFMSSPYIPMLTGKRETRDSLQRRVFLTDFGDSRGDCLNKLKLN